MARQLLSRQRQIISMSEMKAIHSLGEDYAQSYIGRCRYACRRFHQDRFAGGE